MTKTILLTVISLILIIMVIISWSPKAYTPILTTSTTLDFGNTAAGTATDLTATITGAADGDQVIVGVPTGSIVANGLFVGWVSSSNTVTVRFLNTNLLTALNPASGTFKILVFKK